MHRRAAPRGLQVRRPALSAAGGPSLGEFVERVRLKGCTSGLTGFGLQGLGFLGVGSGVFGFGIFGFNSKRIWGVSEAVLMNTGALFLALELELGNTPDPHDPKAV